MYQCINFRRKIQTSQEYFDNKLPCIETFVDTYFGHVEEIELNSIELSAKEEIIEEYLEFPEEENVVVESPKQDRIASNENPIRRYESYNSKSSNNKKEFPLNSDCHAVIVV